MGWPYLKKRHGLSETLPKQFYYSRLLVTITLCPQGPDAGGPCHTWTFVVPKLTSDPAPGDLLSRPIPSEPDIPDCIRVRPCGRQVHGSPLRTMAFKTKLTKQRYKEVACSTVHPYTQTLWGQGFFSMLSFYPLESCL